VITTPHEANRVWPLRGGGHRHRDYEPAADAPDKGQKTAGLARRRGGDSTRSTTDVDAATELICDARAYDAGTTTCSPHDLSVESVEAPPA